ncbi:MAG TPA: histidine phosphatase family protein [Holophaga sp.]|nr:histidine phosphatase family protein [Holophaga sp.]
MTPLFLLRHGPTAASQAGAPLGRLDLPVTPEGQTQWPRVRQELLGLGLQRVLTSDLQRAKRHAMDLGLPVLVLPDLSEQAFGEWEGVPWTEIQNVGPFFHEPVKSAPPGGESFARCASRTLMALQGALDGEQSTLVLAHGGPLRAILAHFLGLSLDRALDLAWQPYGLTALEVFSPNRAILRFHNRPLG